MAQINSHWNQIEINFLVLPLGSFTNNLWITRIDLHEKVWCFSWRPSFIHFYKYIHVFNLLIYPWHLSFSEWEKEIIDPMNY